MTGVGTNVCVESTLRAGFFKNYYIVCPRDCVATYNPTLHEATLENISYHFGVVTESEALGRCWASEAVLQKEGREREADDPFGSRRAGPV
jgi:ureidoacrylate peracid hydrolase